jgi:hypothetical protein
MQADGNIERGVRLTIDTKLNAQRGITDNARAL